MVPRRRISSQKFAFRFAVYSSCLALLTALFGFGATEIDTQPSRIVAVGDLHGNFERMKVILQSANLVDAENRWIGGEAYLVVTGDFLDRGTQVREVMDLLMELEEAAPKAGGRVLVLLGNHEMMNLVGDLRYVTPETYAAFADRKSEDRQKKAYEQTLKTKQREAKKVGLPAPEDTSLFRSKWMENHPPGFVEYREALGPKGRYGRWIRTLPVVVRVGDIIFVHGGIHPNLSDYSLEEINERIAKETKAFDTWVKYFTSEGVFQPYYQINDMMVALKQRIDWLESSVKKGTNGNDWTAMLGPEEQHQVKYIQAFLKMGGWLGMHPDGPLWFRGYGLWTEEEGTPKINQILAAYGADYFVVGHTIAADKEILRRFGSRVFLVDTVEPSALEIAGDEFRAIYAEGPELNDEVMDEPIAAPNAPGS